MTRFALAVVCVCVCHTSAFAQDLFELEVFPSGMAAPGETHVEMHANGIAGDDDARVAPDHPFHASVEVIHGWTDHFETGVFVETAPLVPAHGVRFAGGHIRPKVRFPSWSRLPFDVSLAVEYGFNRTAFDENRQTLEFVPILERRSGRLALIANPEWSVSLKGPDTAELPKLSASGKAAWRVTPRAAFGVEYYWKTEALKHFNPVVDRHHFLLPMLDLEVSPAWEVNLGAGHCLTGDHEGWIVKSIVGRRFGR